MTGNNEDKNITAIKKALDIASLKKKTEEQRKKEAEDQIQEYLNAIPIAEGSELDLKKEEEKRIEILRKIGLGSEEIAEFVRKDVTLIKLSYQDRRPCFQNALFNRKYIESELFKKIESALAGDITIENLSKTAVVNFDLNGLKAMNDLGGHLNGDRGLGYFAEMIQEGKTIKWLKTIGIESIPYTQGGDEFGVLLSGKTDLGAMREEIEKNIFNEVRDFDASDLIDFKNEKVAEFLKDRNMTIPGKVTSPDGKEERFVFKMSTSVGIATIWDALVAVEFKDTEGVGERIKKIRGAMIGIADEHAMEHKEKVKKILKETGMLGDKFVGKELYFLYTRLTPVSN